MDWVGFHMKSKQPRTVCLKQEVPQFDGIRSLLVFQSRGVGIQLYLRELGFFLLSLQSDPSIQKNLISKDVVWMCIKNNNCNLVKRNGMQFSRERGNLKAMNSYKYSGLFPFDDL